MIRSINEFEDTWTRESDATRKLFAQLTDRSLTQAVTSGHRTLGRLAWHLAISIPEMMNRTGLTVSGPAEDAPVPPTAKAICDAYDQAARSLLTEMRGKWTDASLKVEDDMYGMKWTRDMTLASLLFHQVHHRGQMTVLMRQAGLRVPGIYGPAKEEWAAMGAEPPEI